MGSVLSIELPLSATYHQLSQHSASTASLSRPPSEPVILASLPSDPATKLPSPLRLFEKVLPKLWSLWECLVLSEPIILFAKSPRDASLACWWLMEFLKPLPIAGAIDYRPYFHIHDVDFDRLLGPSAAQQLFPPPSNSASGTSTPTQGQAPRGVLLGVTNPFFETIVKRAGWPHVVSLGHITSDSDLLANSGQSEVNGGTSANGNGRDLGGRGMMAALDLLQEEGGGSTEGGRRVASEGTGASAGSSMGMGRSASG